MNGAMNNYGSAQQTQYPVTQFIQVPNLMTAYMWQVLPGETVNFMDMKTPYMYRKSVTFAQPDEFSFEVYLLDRKPLEDFLPQNDAAGNEHKAEIDQIQASIQDLSSKWDQKFDEMYRIINGLNVNNYRKRNDKRENQKEMSNNE